MKTQFSGSFTEAKHLFTGTYQQKPVTRLSPYQERLFQIALKGYNAFTKQEQARLTYSDRKIIERGFGVTKRVLNEMKQTMTRNTITQLFGKLFPDARGAGLSLLMMPVSDKTFTTKAPLDVPKEALIKRLIVEGVLPETFYQKAA